MDILTNLPSILTPIEAAKVLRVGRTTMYQLIQRGEVKHIKIGRKVLIPRLYLQEFIENKGEM